MKNSKSYLITALFIALCAANMNAQRGHEKNVTSDSILVDGIWRTFEYHIPLYPVNNSRLVVVFHDDKMDANTIQEVTGFEFNKLADKTAGTIVVYPQAQKKFWSACQKKPQIEVGDQSMNDVRFIKSIVQRMERRYHIDRKNVFAVGYFNGGNMCYALAGETPDIFKGFAVIGTNTSENSNSKAIRYDYFSVEGNNRVSFLKIVKGGYPFPNPNANKWPQIGGSMEEHINIPGTIMRFFYQLQYQNSSSLGK